MKTTERKHRWLAALPSGGLSRDVLNNHAEFLKRLEFLAGHGYDLIGERDFIYRQCLPLSGRILEVGTGKGHFALTLARYGHRFTSVDINPAEQDMARMNLSYYGYDKAVEFRLADAGRLPFADESMDAVLSVNVAHHLTRPLETAEEMVRVLKKTGKIVLSDFTNEGIALINYCHALEGRIHDEFIRKMDVFSGYFQAEEFRLDTSRSRHQEVLVASRA